ncbi:MAG: ATP-binding cassette domain-containing protein [Firmicutes bacterium]|jgi:ABC-type sugar transport system ATPase subunit|nr:ATP-binding cassette domain-containing protein [Bacillota bacterium]
MFSKRLKKHLEGLKGISLDFEEGEYVSLLGKSGSGKSTMLNIIGGLMKPTQGTVSIMGTDITAIIAPGKNRWPNSELAG